MNHFLGSGTLALLCTLLVSPAWAQIDTRAATAASLPMQTLLESRVDHAPSILVSAERIVARVPLEKVRQEPRKDSVANGIGIGAAIGGGVAFALITTMYARCGAGCDAPAFTELGVPVTLFGAGVGGLVGYLVDRAK